MPYKDPEKLKENKRQYYLKHRESNLIKAKAYREANREQCNKTSNICRWKANGLNHTDEEIEEIYERYSNTTHCDCCNVKLTLGKGMTGKCMDHNHKNGKFRNILCSQCNLLRYHIDERYVHLMRLMSM